MSKSIYAVTHEGELYAWGSNICGQLGIGDQFSRFCVGVRKTKGIEGKVTQVVDAFKTFYALTEEGRVYTWGLIL